MLALERHADVPRFLAVAGEFLVAREAEHNLILGLAGTLHDHPGNYPLPPELMTVRDGDRVVAATLRTPPQQFLLSEIDDPRAIDLLVDAMHGTPLPGVLGPARHARDYAERWAARNGMRALRDVQERIFRLDRVIPPRPVTGICRQAVESDRKLLGDWWLAFSHDIGLAPHEDPANIADRWLRRAGRIIYLWEDGGEVVSLAGIGGSTPHGTRVGPVYTPNERRGRGYASALVAAISSRALAEGRQFCFLFTDLANPTSNHIYQAIGYTAVTDVDEYRFNPL